MKCILILVCLAFSLTSCSDPPVPTYAAHGRFKNVKIYHREGNDDPLVMLVYNDQSESKLTEQLVNQLLVRQTDIITVSTSQLMLDFPDDIKNCSNISGDFDNLARYLEAYLQYQGFIPPIIVTTPGSEPLTSAVLPRLSGKAFLGKFALVLPKAAAKSPVNSVRAATTSPCLPQSKAPQEDPAPTISISVTGHKASSLQLEEAFQTLYERLPPEQVLDESVADLPLTELPSDKPGDSLAILISGDGGWAGFDKKLAEELRNRGFAVVGWDSLRYFWKARTPESVAADINKVFAWYVTHWEKKKLFLLGFSQGANVLPFTLDLLNETTKNGLDKVALISPEKFAQFEFHLGNWIHATDSGMALLPVLQNYHGSHVMCLYGNRDKNSVCPDLQDSHIEVHRFEGGHHLDQDVDEIVDLLLH